MSNFKCQGPSVQIENMYIFPFLEDGRRGEGGSILYFEGLDWTGLDLENEDL